MADDARLSTALPRHPKTVKLRRRLGADGCWALVCLFLWSADNRCDGDLSGLSTEDIEIASDWSHDQGVFVRTLVEVGFLDGQELSYVIHDWAEHNPYAAMKQKRVEAAKEANRIRWERERQAKGIRTESEPDAHRTKPDSPPHHTTTHHTTTPKPIAIVSPKPDSPTDVTQYVMQGMSLSGVKMGWLVKDAVERAMKAHELPAMGAAALIVSAWNEYESANDIPFKRGKTKFLEEGLFNSKSRWRNGNGNTSSGILDELCEADGQANGELGQLPS